MNFPLSLTIPHTLVDLGTQLYDAGFEAYLVGGCVRDILIGQKPKDWDIATNAKPEELVVLFPHSHYDNTYGTVKVVPDNPEDDSLAVVEITTYRTESEYSDNRRPDSVTFSTQLAEDLARRDFTINSLALAVPRETDRTDRGDRDDRGSDRSGSQLTVTRETIVDLFGGIDDLSAGVIRTVGEPAERFSEDALRLMRAVRFAAQLNFVIDPPTLAAIQSHASRLGTIAIERIQIEFNSLLMSANPSFGLEVARRTELLPYIVPELLDAVGVEQNQAHSFTVWEHLVRSCQATADKGWPLHLRIAALFHDISKPATRAWSDVKKDWTFYGHEVVGSRETRRILERLKYPRDIQEKVTKLVRWHMFFSDTETITLSAVRRLVRNVGEDLIQDLLKLRIADRIGTGRPKEQPYRLRKYASMIDEALRSPLSVKMLAINGKDLMTTFHMKPGPTIGHLLNALMEEVVEQPELNTEEQLLDRAAFLVKLSADELRALAERGKRKIQEEEEKALDAVRNRHHVR